MSIWGSFSYSQTIQVICIDTGIPLSSCHVSLKNFDSGEEQTNLTDKTGKAVFNFKQIETSRYAVKIFHYGYETLFDTVPSIENKVFYLTKEHVEIGDVVVTGQYAPGKIENSVHNIKVIDRKKIDAMAAVNLRDVLTNEMNIRLSQDNVLGSSMSLQGISGQNIKILIDGVPVTGRMNGNIDLSQLNMNNVERIEIIEGPLSVIYGTDALGGTINIITKKSQKETIDISSDNYYESIGQYNFTGRIGFRKKQELISISGGRNYFDGWRNDEKPFHIEKTRIADSMRFKSWKPKEQWFGTLNYAHYFKTLKLGYTGDVFFETVTNRGMPRLPYYETAFDDYYRTRRISNSLNLNGQVSKNYFINVIAAYNHFRRIKNTYFNDLTTLNQVLTSGLGDQDTSVFADIIARGTISRTKKDAKINYEAGFDINNGTAKGIRIENGSRNITDYAIFSSLEYVPIKGLVFKPGVRLIYNTAYKAPIVPSFNIKYSVPVRKNDRQVFAFRFSYARGFRAPSLKELYYDFVDLNHNITGNKDLKAEQSNNFNFSSSFTLTRKILSWKIDLSLFYNSIDNMISLAQSSITHYTYFNVDKYKSLGTQLSNEFGFYHFKVTLGAAYIGRFNQLSSTYPSEAFIYSPEGRLNLSYDWQKIDMSFAFFYKYTGKLPTYMLDASNQLYKSTMNDYQTADFSITKLFFKRIFGVTIGAKNLFNVRNVTGATTGAAHTSTSNSVSVGMGRTYFLKFSINLDPKKLKK